MRGAIARKLSKAVWFARTYGQHLPLAVEAVARFGCSVRMLRGRLRNGGGSIEVLYVGRGRNFGYLARSIFEDYRLTDAVDCTVFSYRPAMKRMAAGADVVVVDIGWPYHKSLQRSGQYVVVPDWISLTVEFPESWEKVVASFRRTARRHDLRLVRRNGYRCEILRDRQSIERFYDEMHRPFIRRRYAGDSALAPRRHVVRRGMQGSLLHICRGDEPVAAGIIYPEGEVMYSLWLGMPREHLDAPPEAAFSALYYFGMQQAFEQGYRYFDFGGTRAFLEDGAYQFKRRWGPFIEDCFSPSSILVRPTATDAALAFCRQLPLLRRSPAGLEALVVAEEGDVGADTFRRLEKDYGCAGIDRITVIAVGAGQDTGRAPEGHRFIRCQPAEFVGHYVGSHAPAASGAERADLCVNR